MEVLVYQDRTVFPAQLVFLEIKVGPDLKVLLEKWVLKVLWEQKASVEPLVTLVRTA